MQLNWFTLPLSLELVVITYLVSSDMNELQSWKVTMCLVIDLVPLAPVVLDLQGGPKNLYQITSINCIKVFQ